MPLPEAEGGTTPGPPFNHTSTWVAWKAKQVDTPTWWPELVAVPYQGDICRFARRVWESFQMPKECYHATKGFKDYTVPLDLHCIGPECLLSIEGHNVWHIGLLPLPAAEDLGLYQSITTLD